MSILKPMGELTDGPDLEDSLLTALVLHFLVDLRSTAPTLVYSINLPFAHWDN